MTALLDPAPTKVCTGCGVEVSRDGFYRNARSQDGLHSRCKSCANKATAQSRSKNRERQRAYDRAHYARTRHLHRAANIQRLYGLTPCQYDALLRRQGHLCALCRRLPIGSANGQRLHVDHDHATGAVRGLLCRDCNHALGKFQDDPDLMRRAAAYVESFR